MTKLNKKMTIGIFELAKLGFYVELKEEFRKFIKREIHNQFASFKNFVFQKKLGGVNLSNILSAKGNTTLNIWVKICEGLGINPKEFKGNILKISAKKRSVFIEPEQLPVLSSPELASLVGHGLGDGHIEEGGCFEYTNRQTSLHAEVSRIIYKIFNGSKYTETNTENARRRRRYNVIVGNILYFVGVPKGNKTLQPFSVPWWILNGSKEIKKAFIRALFDDEGTVKVSAHEILIKFSKNEKYINSLQSFMEQIKKLLEDLGIEVTSIRKGDEVIGKNGHTIQLVLGIHGYKNFVKFFKEIKFNDHQKQKKLGEMINSYKSFQHRSGETQKILYENLFKPLTIYDLMNNLNMTYMTVYKSIKKLEKRGLVKGIEYSKNQPIIWSKSK